MQEPAGEGGNMTDPSPGAPLSELPVNEKKQQFCLAFVHMVTAAAGCSIKSHSTDYDGVDMNAGPFRRLTNPKRYCAAYLGVLVVPTDPGDWLDQDETRLISQSRMYWARAADLGTIDDGATTKTVYLPRGNLFDVQQLRGIMETIGDGGGT